MGAFRRDRDNDINAQEDGAEDQRERERETVDEGDAADQHADEPMPGAAAAADGENAAAGADNGAALDRNAATVRQEGLAAAAAGRNDLVASAITFVTTFFSSLLPDQPQVA